MSISEHQDAATRDQSAANGAGHGDSRAHGGTGGHGGAALGSIEAEQNESSKRVPPAAKWGMAGLLLVYTGLGTYALVSTIGSSAGPGHPEGVTRSVAIALGKSAAPSRVEPSAAPGTPASSSAAPGTQASGAAGLPARSGQLPTIKWPSGAADQAQPSTPPDEVLTAISAVAVGPDGASDGDHPALASLVLAPHSEMSWVTHWYATAYFGNLQDGTGLLLDMGRSVTIRQIELALGGSPGFWGADLQIRVGATPDLAGLAPVTAVDDVGGWVTAKLQAPASGRYVQIWFTKLPLDPQGTFQEHVYGITVHGSAPRPSRSSASWVNVHGHSQASHPGRPWNAHRKDGHGYDGYSGTGNHGHGGGHGGAKLWAGSSLGIRCRIDPWASARCR